MCTKFKKAFSLKEICKRIIDNQLVIDIYQIIKDDINSNSVYDYLDLLYNNDLKLIKRIPLILDIPDFKLSCFENFEVQVDRLTKYIVIAYDVINKIYYPLQNFDKVVILEKDSIFSIYNID